MAETGAASSPSNASGTLDAKAGGEAASNLINVAASQFQGSAGKQCSKIEERNTISHCYAPQRAPIPEKDKWKDSDSTVPSAQGFMLGVDDLTGVRELKKMVLNREGRRVAALGVQGNGGVGKTTACTIVARDPDVRRCYKDASVWIQLGDDASAMTVVKQVALIVRETGGHVCATDIEEIGDKDLDEVRKKARGWFSERSILFIVDNVFRTSSALVRGGNWISILQDIPSANSCVLFSTRSPDVATLSDKTVKFGPLTSFEEQKKMLLRHLGLSYNANGISDDEVLELHSICGGVPLALATVASYLRSDHISFRKAFDALQTSLVKEKEQATVLGGHAGLFAIFGAVLIRLDEDKERFLRHNADEALFSAKLPYSWRELYTSLCVLDKSSPHVPVGILSGLWGLAEDLTTLVCRCFANLGLGTLVPADRGSLLEFQVHDLQRSYCVIESRNSSVPFNSLSTWHARLLEGLVGRTSAKEYHLTASSSRTVGYVDAFCAIPGGSDEHWFEHYWLDHFVRHVRGIDDGVDTATDAVTDYRWVRRVAERRSPAEVARRIEQLLAADEVDGERLDEGGSSSGAARGVSRGLSAMNEQDVSELEDIADVFRWEIPPEAAKPQLNVNERAAREGCAVHRDEWSVGDSGLAHRIVGRLGFLRGGGGAVEAATTGSSEAGRIGVMDALVASVKKYARGPWLCPKHPCFVVLDRDGLERVIRRRNVNCCVAYSHGGEDCAALGCDDGDVYLYRLGSGEEVGLLHADKYADAIRSMTVSSREPSVCDGVHATWLVVGHMPGIIRIWDVERARCIARLHASTDGLTGIGISRDRGRVVAFYSDDCFLHVWDISPEGEQKRYEIVEVPRDYLTRRTTHSEFAAAAALCGESRPLDGCTNAVTRFRRRSKKLVRFRQDSVEMSVSTENDFIRDKGYRVLFARVQGCDSRALLAAVDEYHGGITVLDALTGEKLSESPPFWQIEEDKSKRSVLYVDRSKRAVLCVSASQVDGRTLVATGHRDWMVCVRSVDSGALIAQWLAQSPVYGIFLDAAARRVLVRCDGAVIVWSFGRGASGQQGEATAQLTEMNDARPSHIASQMNFVGFSPNGQTAVSWNRYDKDVIVWDAAAGSAVRRIHLDWPYASRALAVSTSADWTLVVGYDFERRIALFTLLDSTGEERSRGTIRCQLDWKSEWSAAFTPDGRGCTVAVEDPENNTKELHQWTISDAGEMTELGNGTAPNVLPPSACLEANPAKQLLLDDRYFSHLVVRRSVRGEHARCTCTAVAYFDSHPGSFCSWSNVAIPGGSSEHNKSSTVAVGLDDGTVHFMEFLEE